MIHSSTGGASGRPPPTPTPLSASTFTTYVDESPKLCGFLLKQSDSSAANFAASKAASAAASFGLTANAGRLPMRRKWFVFNETTCRLYWYKSPSDLDPLGEVDIAAASFEVVVENPKNLVSFRINTRERSLTLEAPDRKTMLYWLQELQSHRQRHVKTLTRSSALGIKIPARPSPRIRRKDNSAKENAADAAPTKDFGAESAQRRSDGTFDDLLPRVSVPIDSVGIGSAILGPAASSVASSGASSGAFVRKESLRGKVMKLLPGRRGDGGGGSVGGGGAAERRRGSAGIPSSGSAETARDSPPPSSSSSPPNLIDFGDEIPSPEVDVISPPMDGIRILAKSPDLHRRAFASGSAASASAASASAASASADQKIPIPDSSSSEAASTSSLHNSSSAAITTSAPNVSSPLSVANASSVMSAPVAASSSSLPEASNQNSFTTGLSNLFKHKNVSPSASANNLSPNLPCHRCAALSSELSAARREIESLRDEREAQRDCHAILTQQLEFQQRKLDARDAVDDPSEFRQWVEDREQELLDLRSVLRKNHEDLEIRRRRNSELEAEAKRATEKAEMLMELVECKDEVVRKLTNQLFEAERRVEELSGSHAHASGSSPGAVPVAASPGAAAAAPVSGTCDHCEAQLVDLEMELAAYKFQNQVCNKEILEQNQLRTDLHDWGRQLCEQLIELEAKLCQAKSERDFLLNERKKEMGQKSFDGSPTSTDDVLERMIEDAMNEVVVDERLQDTAISKTLQRQTEVQSPNGLYYDDYGFLKGQSASSPTKDDEELLTKAKSYDMYSRDLQDSLGEPGDYEVSCRVKWENFMASQLAMNGGEIVRSPELKLLVRMGIPNQYRWCIWRSCIKNWLSVKDEDLGGESWASKIGSSYYKDLVDSCSSDKPCSTITRDGTLTSGAILHPLDKQIELDLLRTLPNNRRFSSSGSEIIEKLRRVLRAFARHNISVGYCQGMNRLAAIPLLVLPDEEDAFWCLVAIVDHVMPESYFSSALVAAQADQRVLKELLSEKCPRLANHLDRLSVDLSLFTFNWFLCLFVDTIPPEIYFKIWDAFLYEGPKVLFRFALAFLKIHEEVLLAASDYIAACAILRSMGEDVLTTDWRALSHVAFETLNPFPLRNIKKSRKQCLAQVRAELEELEAIRQKYRRESKRGEKKGENLSESDEEG